MWIVFTTVSPGRHHCNNNHWYVFIATLCHCIGLRLLKKLIFLSFLIPSDEIAKLYSVTELDLTRKCSDEHIIKIGEFVSWKDVGLHLSMITSQDIKDMESDGRDQKEKRRMLLGKWVEGNGSNATYDAMMAAMVRAGKRNEAEEVCKLLTSGGMLL